MYNKKNNQQDLQRVEKILDDLQAVPLVVLIRQDNGNLKFVLIPRTGRAARSLEIAAREFIKQCEDYSTNQDNN